MSGLPETLRRRGLPAELDGIPASVPAALAERARRPDDPFVVGPDFRLTFGEAERGSAEFAGRLLAAGIGKGTRVGILYPNNADWAVVWLAAARIGALTIPLICAGSTSTSTSTPTRVRGRASFRRPCPRPSSAPPRPRSDPDVPVLPTGKVDLATLRSLFADESTLGRPGKQPA